MELIPNLSTVLFEILNFLVLAFLLYRFLFKPVMSRVEERAREKQTLLVQMQADREAAASLRVTLEERLASAEEESAAILLRAQEDAKVERAAFMQEAHTEAERILVESYAEVHRIRKQAMDAFHAELLSTILEISGMVVGQMTPEETHTAMVKQLTDRVWEMGRNEMQRVETFRRALADRTPTVYVTTARPLTSELQGLLARTFTALADRNVNLDIKVDPALAVGARVRLGDVVIDNSIAGHLDGLEESVARALQERMSDE